MGRSGWDTAFYTESLAGYTMHDEHSTESQHVRAVVELDLPAGDALACFLPTTEDAAAWVPMLEKVELVRDLLDDDKKTDELLRAFSGAAAGGPEPVDASLGRYIVSDRVVSYTMKSPWARRIMSRRALAPTRTTVFSL